MQCPQARRVLFSSAALTIKDVAGWPDVLLVAASADNLAEPWVPQKPYLAGDGTPLPVDAVTINYSAELPSDAICQGQPVRTFHAVRHAEPPFERATTAQPAQLD